MCVCAARALVRVFIVVIELMRLVERTHVFFATLAPLYSHIEIGATQKNKTHRHTHHIIAHHIAGIAFNILVADTLYILYQTNLYNIVYVLSVVVCCIFLRGYAYRQHI